MIMLQQLRKGFSTIFQTVKTQKFFNGKENLAIKQLEQFQQKYQYGKNQAIRLLNIHPQAFLKQNPKYNVLHSRLVKLTNLGKRFQILKRISHINHGIIFSMTDADIDNFVKTAQQYDLSQSQLENILIKSFNVVNPNFNRLIEQKYGIFQDYLQIPINQINQLMAQWPILLPASSQRIKESIVFFLGLKLEKEKIIKLLHQFGYVFLVGSVNLSMIYRTVRSWGLIPSQFFQTYLNHPLLFLNDPQKVMPYKIRVLKYFKFEKSLVKKMLIKYPSSLVWSISSLETKCFFITQRLKLNINQESIELFKYKFSTVLRPRGELLIKLKQHLTASNIAQKMKITDEQFIKQFPALTLERFNEEKSKYPITNELDYKLNKISKCHNFKAKIIEMTKRYQ